MATEGTEVKATEAAQRKAEELGVDLTTVEGTGAEGQIKVEDVETAAREQQGDGGQTSTTEATAPPEKRFAARINPALGGNVDHVTIGDRDYYEGEPLTEDELDHLKEVGKIGGHQMILKGKEVK